MKTETEPEVIIVFNVIFSCPQPFLDDVKQEILDTAPGVPEGALLTTKQLCSEKFYSPLSKWEKSVAGACMDYLTRNGLVPFENVPRRGRNPYPLQYRVVKNWNQ